MSSPPALAPTLAAGVLAPAASADAQPWRYGWGHRHPYRYRPYGWFGPRRYWGLPYGYHGPWRRPFRPYRFCRYRCC